MIYRQKNKIKIQKTKKTFELIKKRNHIYVNGTYENKKSVLVIFCNIHQIEHITTFSNYCRSRTGCPCCGKEQVSQKLKNRQFSVETLEKMSLSALQRPSRGGKPRKWRKTPEYRNWRNTILSRSGYMCQVTGKQTKGSLVVHHLYNASDFEDFTYILDNGLVLDKEIHKAFHMKYGYENNTPSQFIAFLDFLLTGSLGEIVSQSSETRARIKQLQERLNKLFKV